jgi:hypothetical protein
MNRGFAKRNQGSGGAIADFNRAIELDIAAGAYSNRSFAKQAKGDGRHRRLQSRH